MSTVIDCAETIDLLQAFQALAQEVSRYTRNENKVVQVLSSFREASKQPISQDTLNQLFTEGYYRNIMREDRRNELLNYLAAATANILQHQPNLSLDELKDPQPALAVFEERRSNFKTRVNSFMTQPA